MGLDEMMQKMTEEKQSKKSSMTTPPPEEEEDNTKPKRKQKSKNNTQHIKPSEKQRNSKKSYSTWHGTTYGGTKQQQHSSISESEEFIDFMNKRHNIHNQSPEPSPFSKSPLYDQKPKRPQLAKPSQQRIRRAGTMAFKQKSVNEVKPKQNPHQPARRAHSIANVDTVFRSNPKRLESAKSKTNYLRKSTNSVRTNDRNSRLLERTMLSCFFWILFF
jgi:hypothetical protein